MAAAAPVALLLQIPGLDQLLHLEHLRMTSLVYGYFLNAAREADNSPSESVGFNLLHSLFGTVQYIFCV